MDTPQPSPAHLAAAMATRLNQVVPSGFSVHAYGSLLTIQHGDESEGASGAAEIIADQDDRTQAERVETAARAMLSGVQDTLMEFLTEECPLGSGGDVAYPNSRVDGDRLLIWFGEEQAPVIALPPIDMAEFSEGAASQALEAGGARRLRNESFFSAPQLKRDSLDRATPLPCGVHT